MRLFAAVGPGDIVSAQKQEELGRLRQTRIDITYSGQLVEYCRERRIELLALSHNKHFDIFLDGIVHLENRPRLWEDKGGLLFHISKVCYSAYLAFRAWRFNADMAIIDASSAHIFALTFFALFRIPVAIDLHNTLWPNGSPPIKRIPRLINSLDGWFLRNIAVAGSGVSPECARQVQELSIAGIPFYEYRCQYRHADFEMPKCKLEDSFRVIFVGRTEIGKGILDLVQIASILRKSSKIKIVFEVCGDGHDRSKLTDAVEKQGLQQCFKIHGHLEKAELIAAYERAQVAIVPTRGDFCEGLPKTCAEAALFGVPIVTSRLSNATPVLGPALIEVEPENVEQYADAILRLCENPSELERRKNSTKESIAQFFDRSQSYPAAIDRMLANSVPNFKILPNYEGIFTRLS